MISQKPLVQTALFTVISAASGQLFAQNSDPKLEEMTITASRIELPLRQVGASVSVLTEEELEQKNYPTIDTVLRTLPSVRVSQNGGLGKATTVRVRGEEGHRTLLLIDGINVADPSATQIAPRFGHVLNSTWGRVEVLRGPQGMMYGADAGGVISIFSKEAEEPFAADVSAEAGSYSTRSINGNIRGIADRLNYSINASHLTSDGFNATVVGPEDDPTSVDDDGYDNTTLHAKAGYAFSDTMGVGLVLRDVDAESQIDRCGFPASNDCPSHYQQQSARVDWYFATRQQSHEMAFTTSETQNQIEVVQSGALDQDSEGELSKWQYFGHYQVATDFSLVFGADHQTDRYANRRIGSENDYEREQHGVFLEAQPSFGNNFYYTAGVRYDDNEDFGSHTSYRLTAAYLVPMNAGELKFKGSLGTGFRAPSLYEVSHNQDSPAEFLPDILTEEMSRGYELGVEWGSHTNTFVEAVWFDNTIEDEIYYFSDSSYQGGYLQSEGETESKGIELNASVEVVDNLLLSANYTWNETSLSNGTTVSGAEGGDPRARRPEHSGNVAVQYNWQDRIDLALFWRTSRDAVDYIWGEGRAELDDYQVLDLTGSWKISDIVEAYLRVENALDEDYQEVIGYHTSGRAGYAGVRLSF